MTGENQGGAAPVAAASLEDQVEQTQPTRLQEQQLQQEYGPAERDTREILASQFQTEEARQAMEEAIPDKKLFSEMNRDTLEQGRVADDIASAQLVEKKFMEIREEMDAIFTEGRPEKFYNPLEKAVVFLCNQISMRLGESMENRFYAPARDRAEQAKLNHLETKLGEYTQKMVEAKKAEHSFRKEVLEAELSLRNQKFKLAIYDLAAEKLQERIVKLESDEATYAHQGNKAEAERAFQQRVRISEDYEKMCDIRDDIAQEVEADAKIYQRTNVRLQEARWANNEHKATVGAYKAHYKNVSHIVRGRKQGISIDGISSGRIDTAAIREEDGKIMRVDGEGLKMADEDLRNQRKNKGLDSEYNNDLLKKLNESRAKRSREMVDSAYATLDKIFSSSPHNYAA